MAIFKNSKIIDAVNKNDSDALNKYIVDEKSEKTLVDYICSLNETKRNIYLSSIKVCNNDNSVIRLTEKLKSLCGKDRFAIGEYAHLIFDILSNKEIKPKLKKETIEKYEKELLEQNKPYLVVVYLDMYNIAGFKNKLINMLKKDVKSATTYIELLMDKDKESNDELVNDIKELVILSNNLVVMLEIAIKGYFNDEEIKSIQDKIVKSKMPKLMFKFATSVKNADKNLIKDELLKLDKLEYTIKTAIYLDRSLLDNISIEELFLSINMLDLSINEKRELINALAKNYDSDFNKAYKDANNVTSIGLAKKISKNN